MAVALQGCVIVKDDGKHMDFKYKCEKCGHVTGNTVRTSPPAKNSKRSGNFKCQKCGTSQKYAIQG